MDVAETVRAAQQGDKSAIEALYNEYIGEIYTIARTYFPRHEDAQDAAHEIFVVVIQKIDMVKKPESFHIWLKRVITNRCVSMVRKKHDELLEEDNSFEKQERDISEVIPYEKLEDDERKEILFRIVSELSEKHRSVILMYYYSNMSVERIAKSLHISEGTVKSRLSYARAKIQKRILAYEKKGVKLYNMNMLNYLGQIISGLAEKSPMTANFSMIANTMANTVSSSVGSLASAHISSALSTSVAHTISNATAARISAVTSAVVVATCIGVTQLPSPEAQKKDMPAVSVVYERDISIVEVTVVETSEVQTTIVEPGIVYEPTVIYETSTVYEPTTVYETSNIYDTSIIHDTSVIENTIMQTSTVYETNVVYRDSEPSIVYVEAEQSSVSKDHSVFHYEEDNMFRYKVYDNADEATLVSVTNPPHELMEELVIPDNINDIPVTAIGQSAFEGQSFFRNVKIGDKIEDIGRSAFACSELRAIELNPQITQIAPRTFDGCKNLQTVTNADSVETIEYQAFSCSDLQEFDFGSNLISVDYYAFQSCPNLRKIVIPASVEYLDAQFTGGTFHETKLLDELVINIDMEHFEEFPYVYEALQRVIKNTRNTRLIFRGNVTEFFADRNDFRGFFEGIREYTETGRNLYMILPDNITKIGAAAFRNLTELISVDMPDTVTEIDKEAFWSCRKLEEIILPQNLKFIGKEAFYQCTSLKEITLPDGLERIEAGAFDSCNSLVGMTIPASVQYIGENAFPHSDFVIYGFPDSYAQYYAEKYELPFVSVSQSENQES